MNMLEGVNLGFDDKEHMVFSACRDCACYRAICIDGNHGFCCSEGKAENRFLPFEYPTFDKDGRLEAIRLYQRNELPEDCKFHTQCSMLNFMEDESVAEGIASEDISVVETTVGELDLTEKAFKTVVERDSGLSDWCRSHSDAKALLMKKNGETKGFVFLTSEQDADYSWIQPAPPEKHYLQKGSKVTGVRLLWTDGDSFDAKLLLGLAYRNAIENGSDDFYAVAYSDIYEMLANGGFKSAGYMIGGNGNDDDTGAYVLVKKVHDLEEKK